MPSQAWLDAAKKTPMQPVFYAACESVEAINVTQRLASDWNAGSHTNLQTFDLPGLDGGAGIRNSLIETTLSLPLNETLIDYHQTGIYAGVGDYTVASSRYVHSIKTVLGINPTYSHWDELVEINPRYTQIYLCQYTGPQVGPFRPYTIISVTESVEISLSSYGNYGQGMYKLPGYAKPLFLYASVDLKFKTPVILEPGVDYKFVVGDIRSGAVGMVMIDTISPSLLRHREINGILTTKTFDLGSAPNINSRVLFDHTIIGTSVLNYAAEGSADNSTWTALGYVSDGGELPPYRYYRITALFHSTGYDTPELYSIRIVGGNQQYVYLGTHRNEPSATVTEVLPYLQDISGISSKISLKDKPTVGDLTLKLAWMPETAELVQSTGKRRSVQVFLGFVGLAKADYEPYFTGIWESYSADADKRVFTVKLRDVWKKFKKKVPEQPIKNGQREQINLLFGKPADGNGTALNIIDAISQVADLAKAPDRYIDKAALSALKTAHFNSASWNVYRTLTEQKDSDELLKELAVTAGVFLVPAANGKLTPYHYDTIVAETPAVTLDAAQIRFTELVPDMAETVTRHNIYFNLMNDAQGRKLGGGDPANYANVYTTIGSNASVIAERDREEVIVGEWFDNWGMGGAAGVPNALTKLGDRMESWFTPIATVNGNQVATTKVSVRAENVPLRYYADVMPGKTVLVDNLRLPCPASSWGGFSDQVKFLVMSWNVDSKKYTLTLDLFQVAPLTYNETPSWSSYNQWGAFPTVSGLTVTESAVAGVDGIVAPYVVASFNLPADFRAGRYEVWYSVSGADYVLHTTIPAGSSTATVSIPAIGGMDYSISVVTVNSRGERQPFQDGPSAAVVVLGAGGVATPENTGLVCEFGGRDCRLTWDAADIPSTLLTGYLVEILSLADVVKRTVTVTDNRFTYTFGMNIDDFSAAVPSFKVRVSTVNANGSTPTPQTITVANAAPAAPTAITTTGQMLAIQLATAFVAPEDFDVVEFWTSATNNIATATLLATVKTGAYTHSGVGAGAVQYYWARVKDIYGQYSSYHPSGTTGIYGAVLNNPTEMLKLLNSDVSSQTALDYFNGRLSLIDVLDTESMAFQTGAVQPGVGANYRATILANDRAILIQAEQIQLKASKGELSAQVDVLSNLIGLKLNATGTYSPGMAISWTDDTHTRSNVTFLTDTFLIAKPDGSGVKSIFSVGQVDGVDSVGVNGNLIVDGSVEARSIATDQLIVGDNIAMGANATISWSKVTAPPTIPSNTNQLTDGAGLGGSATWGGVSGKPSNVAGLSGSEQILNSQMTWNGLGSKPTNLASLTGSEAILNSQITLVDLGGMPISPGTPTNIGANWIYTGALTAGQVNALTVNANIMSFLDTTNGHISLGKTSPTDDSHSGFWLGNQSGTAKFSIGDGASFLKWDGSALDYTGKIRGDYIIKGSVLSDGTIASGTGFSITRASTGVYNITFSPAFTNTPTIVAGSNYQSAISVAAGMSNGTSGTIRIYKCTDGTAFDAHFCFIAVGN